MRILTVKQMDHNSLTFRGIDCGQKVAIASNDDGIIDSVFGGKQDQIDAH